ncbi:MAG: bifunctional ADP-heptose synthase [Saprospiraceae bacterium]
MNKTEILSLPDFSDLHIVVIGDVMIDRYISGEVKRISPEAPVPIVEMDHRSDRLGGAANVAVNLHAFGAKVTLLSIIGEDEGGKIIMQMSDAYEHISANLITVHGRKTTVKTRIMSNTQHLLRIDHEDKADINIETEDILIVHLKQILNSSTIHGIILQDYNKGLLTQGLIEQIMCLANSSDIPTFIDPKEKNFFTYKGCTVFKPNKKEIMSAINHSTEDLNEIDQIVRQNLSHELTIVTLGNEGLYMHDGRDGQNFSTSSRVIADVCGAGDTVISAITLGYLKNLPLSSLALLANTAGGQVCEKPGVVSVDLQELRAELGEYP